MGSNGNHTTPTVPLSEHLSSAKNHLNKGTRLDRCIRVFISTKNRTEKGTVSVRHGQINEK
jgi:hypothetical protein